MDREPYTFDNREAQRTLVLPPERHQQPVQDRAIEPELPAPGSRNYRSQPSRPGRPRSQGHQSRERGERPQAKPERDRSAAVEPVSISDRYRNLLAEIGRFRVVRAADLKQPFFSGSDRSMAETLVKLRSAGLIEDHLVRHRSGRHGHELEKVRLISLTREGKRMAARKDDRGSGQRLYAGFVKPREALHDSNLYPVYRAHAARLERTGATVRSVVLDFELKQNYLRERRRRERTARSASEQSLKADAAARCDLPIVNGKVQFPDLRIEYEDCALGPAKVDIELTTASYSRSHLAGKVQAGFTLYASPGDHGRVGAAVHDDHDLVGEILSF